MNNEPPRGLQDISDWDNIWRRYFNKYQGDIRHAYCVAAVRRRSETRVLELAAGSFRDMAALNRWGVACEGVDFSMECVNKARETFPLLRDKIKNMDGKRLEYGDKTWDLTYHNGFWACFDDATILDLAKEQARVTKGRMIATVHNAHNPEYKSMFEKKSAQDSIYRARFFRREEVVELMKPSCSHVTVLPVGGGRVDNLIARGYGPNLMRWLILLRAHAFNARSHLETSQRLMCIGKVRL